MAPRRSKSSKNPPIFSHEFVIQNHADIVSCVAMVFVLGLMFQATSPVASLFVAMQHNVTVNNTDDTQLDLYTYGAKDIFGVFFYLLITIVIHAVVQEYVLDKLNRKMHLSKVKHSKFNESGQLMVFYFCSAVWGADIILRESYVTNINQLWEGYPHSNIPFIVKFYFIIQMCNVIQVCFVYCANLKAFDMDNFKLWILILSNIAYWVHCLPELYFQKVKKDEILPRIQYTALYFIFITGAYALSLNRVALCMIVLHYLVEFVYHGSRLLHFAEKTDLANSGFMVFNVVFVLVRLGSIILSVLTFWYGLQLSSQSSINFATGNFNTQLVRINCLAAVCLLQAWMMWNFITFHLKKLRERSATVKRPRSPMKRKTVKGSDEDISSLPEVDQDSAVTENGTVRARARGKKN